MPDENGATAVRPLRGANGLSQAATPQDHVLTYERVEPRRDRRASGTKVASPDAAWTRSCGWRSALPRERFRSLTQNRHGLVM